MKSKTVKTTGAKSAKTTAKAAVAEAMHKLAHGDVFAVKYGLHVATSIMSKGAFYVRASQIVTTGSNATVERIDGSKFSVALASDKEEGNKTYCATFINGKADSLAALEVVKSHFTQRKSSTCEVIKVDNKNAALLATLCEAKRSAIDGYTGATYSNDETLKASRIFGARGNDVLLKTGKAAIVAKSS